MAFLRRECKGLGLTSPYPIKRYDWSRGLMGSGLWAFDQMYDEAGNLVDFYIDKPRVLRTHLQVMIRHRYIPIAGYTDYSLYANARIHLAGPYAAKADIPALDWTSPQGPGIGFIGTNISGFADHYAAPNLMTQDVLQPGYYRLETYAAAGTDASDVDYLAEIADYSGSDLPAWTQGSIHQFWASVE